MKFRRAAAKALRKRRSGQHQDASSAKRPRLDLGVDTIQMQADSIFKQLDTNSDNRICYDEWSAGMTLLGEVSRHGLTEEEMCILFSFMDEDRDGFITKQEWANGVPWLTRILGALHGPCGPSQTTLVSFKSTWASRLCEYDPSGTGRLDLDTFCRAVASESPEQSRFAELSQDDLRMLFGLLANGNSQLSYGEWLNLSTDSGLAGFRAGLKKTLKTVGAEQFEKAGVSRLTSNWQSIRNSWNLPGSVYSKMKRTWSEVWNAIGDLFDPLSFILDVVGIVVGCFVLIEQLRGAQTVDWLAFIPFFLGCARCSWLVLKNMHPHRTKDLVESEALLYRTVFQPEAVSVEEFVHFLARSKAVRKRIPADTEMWSASDVGVSVKFVTSGFCDMIRNDGSVEEHLEPGAWIGELGFLGGTSYEHVGNIRTRGETTLISWSIADVTAYLKHHEALQLVFQRVLTRSVADKMMVARAKERKQVAEFEMLLENVVRAAREHLHFERSTLYLVDSESRSLITLVADGLREAFAVPFDSDTIVAATHRENRILAIPDVEADPRFMNVADKTKDWHAREMLSCPVVDNEDKSHVIAVIQLINKASISEDILHRHRSTHSTPPEHKEVFDRHDIELARLLCWHTSMLITSLR